MSKLIEEEVKMLDNLRSTVKSYQKLKKERAETAAKLYDTFLKNLIFRFSSDKRKHADNLKDFFKKDKLRIVAVDGTLYKTQRRGCITFYVLAAPLLYELDLNKCKFYRSEEEISKKNVMALIPIPLSELFLLYGSENKEHGDDKESIEEDEDEEENVYEFWESFKVGRVDTKFMKLAETYAIYWAIKNLNPDVIMYDGSFFKDYSFSNRDVDKIHLHEGSILDNKLDKAHFELLKVYPINQHLEIPSIHFTTHFISAELLTHDEIILIKDVDSYKFRSKLLLGKEVSLSRKQVNNLIKKNYIQVIEYDDKLILRLKEKYTDSFEKLKNLFLSVCQEGFDNHNLEAFKIYTTPQSYRYFSEEDIDTLCRIGYILIIQECWKNNILLFSIIKDTTERSFIDCFLTIAGPRHIGVFNFDTRLLPMVPSTDAGMLFDISTLRKEKLSPPLSLIEYDPAITTLYSKFNKDNEEFVLESPRGIQEREFLRTFVQITEFPSGRRSYVYTVDRIMYPQYDRDYDVLEVPLTQRKIYKFAYYTFPSEILKVIIGLLVLLSSNRHESVFGYPDPLYEADQYVKTIGATHRETLEIALSEIDLDEFSTTYRQMRSETGG